MCDNNLGDLALGVRCPEEQRFAPTLANDPLVFNKPFSRDTPRQIKSCWTNSFRISPKVPFWLQGCADLEKQKVNEWGLIGPHSLAQALHSPSPLSTWGSCRVLSGAEIVLSSRACSSCPQGSAHVILTFTWNTTVSVVHQNSLSSPSSNRPSPKLTYNKTLPCPFGSGEVPWSDNPGY